MQNSIRIQIAKLQLLLLQHAATCTFKCIYCTIFLLRMDKDIEERPIAFVISSQLKILFIAFLCETSTGKGLGMPVWWKRLWRTTVLTSCHLQGPSASLESKGGKGACNLMPKAMWVFLTMHADSTTLASHACMSLILTRSSMRTTLSFVTIEPFCTQISSILLHCLQANGNSIRHLASLAQYHKCQVSFDSYRSHTPQSCKSSRPSSCDFASGHNCAHRVEEPCGAGASPGCRQTCPSS